MFYCCQSGHETASILCPSITIRLQGAPGIFRKVIHSFAATSTQKTYDGANFFRWRENFDDVRTYIRTYVRTMSYVRTYVRTHVETYVRTYVHTYVRTYVRTCVRTYIRYVRTYVRYVTYVRTYVRTYVVTWRIRAFFDSDTSYASYTPFSP